MVFDSRKTAHLKINVPSLMLNWGFTKVVNHEHDADEYIHEEHEKFDKLVDGV
jgi:hypothetical protein